MMDTLQKTEYNNLFPGNSSQAKYTYRFNFMPTVPSVDVDPNPLFYLNKFGAILGCNKCFETLSGRARHDVISKNINVVFTPSVAAKLKVSLDQGLQSNRVQRFILTDPLFTKNLDSKHYLGTMACGMDLGESIIFCTLLDISDIPLSVNEIDNTEMNENYTLSKSNIQPGTPPSFESLVRSKKMKVLFLDWLNKLQSHLTSDGKLILNSVIRRFKNELNSELYLRFEQAFDDEHFCLYQALKNRSSCITKNEMRLCALLSKDNTPSEIARLTARSANCINVAFTRIRQKLQFKNNQELKLFLHEVREVLDGKQVSMRVNI